MGIFFLRTQRRREGERSTERGRLLPLSPLCSRITGAESTRIGSDSEPTWPTRLSRLRVGTNPGRLGARTSTRAPRVVFVLAESDTAESYPRSLVGTKPTICCRVLGSSYQETSPPTSLRMERILDKEHNKIWVGVISQETKWSHITS